MHALYGENKMITGDYDSTLAAVCDNGTFVGKEKEGVLIFKGIPFAAPPVGELRWKAPQPAAPSQEIREAYYFGKSPIQAPLNSEMASCYPNGEDCLYLNVWTATGSLDADNTNTVSTIDAALRPVMVFIHGGAYGYGGTADPLYDGFNFVKAHPEVILVSIAYRIGIMGFIDFSNVHGSEGYEDSCNLGLLDQIEALRWIQRNIESFGGDPANVTLFGESAGAGSVSILPLMPIARGLFKRVIAESGSIALTYSREEAKLFTELFMKEAKAETMQDLLKLSQEEIWKINEPINDKNNFPVRDGRIIPEDLYEAYECGESIGVDMISGSNKDECRYWIGEMGGLAAYAAAIPVLFENHVMGFEAEDIAKAKQYYKHGQGEIHWRLTEFDNDLIFRVPAQEQLLLHSDNGGNAYHYFWTFPSAIKNYGACHAVELAFVFNNPEEKIFTGGNYSQELADEVQQMWVNFAKTGDPSTEKNKWPKYDSRTKQTLVFGEKIYVKENLLSRRTAIIKDLLKYRINGNYGALNFNIPYIWIVSIAGFLIIATIILIFVFIIK